MRSLKIEASQALHAEDEELLKALISSYALLSRLVPADDAALLLEMHKAITDGIETIEVFLLSSRGKQAIEAQKRIVASQLLLAKDMREFVASKKTET